MKKPLLPVLALLALAASPAIALTPQNINSVPGILGAWPISTNVTITANSTVGLPVEFSVVSGNATISNNNTVQIGGTIGPIVLQGSQPGNDTYSAAPQITTTLYAGPANGTITNTTFVITNNSNVPEDEIFVTFMGAIPQTTPPQTYGNGFEFTGNTANSSITSYTLANLTANLTVNGTASPRYTFSLNSYSGGRIFISYGQPVTAAPGYTFDAPYGVWEMTIFGNLGVPASATAGGTTFSPAPLAYSPSSNFDISYVDGISIPMKTTVRNTDWSVQTTSTTNPVWTHPAILSEISALVPSDARLSGNGTLTINGTQVDLSQKIIRVISPSFPYGSSGDQALYHQWGTLLDSLISTNGSVRVASHKTDSTNQQLQPYNLAGVLFGYAGGGSSDYTNQAPNMLNEQDYDYRATFTANLNPGGNTTLTALGIGNGTAGVHLTGNLTSVGPTTCTPFDIYITRAQMNQPQGIYGSNPKYVVFSTDGSFTSYETAGIQNDLSGRMVGDLMAGIVFGWANSTVNITSQAATTGLNLANSTFSSPTVGGISSGELFFLLSLAAAQTTSGNNSMLTHWVGAGLQTNPEYYDIYSSSVFARSVAYGTAFGDRFQGNYSPDTSWYSSNPPPNSTGFWPLVGFAEIELLPVSFPDAQAGPAITVNATLTPFSTTNGTASAAQAFTASGANLLDSILVNAPAGFELSTTGVGSFSANLTLAPTSGTVPLTNIFARIAAGAGVGPLSGNISLASTNATTQNVAVGGNVTGSGTPYQHWVSYWTTQNASFNGTSTNGSADPDGDGYVNDTEFAFDGNPTVPTASLLTASASGGNMTVSFIARNSTPAGATYQVQETHDLTVGFVSSNASVSMSDDQTGILIPAQYQRRQFTVPMTDPKKFYRVRATLN